MNIAQKNQAKLKARIAAGESVVVTAPTYSVLGQTLTGNAAVESKSRVLASMEKKKQVDLNSVENKDMNQEYDIIKASLEADLTTLKSLKSIDKKREYKEHIIANYLDYLKKYAESEHNHPNGILSQLVVWLFDIEMFEQAKLYADLAIEQGQRLPARFKTPNFETFICDELADHAKRQLKAKKDAPELQYAIDGLDSGWDVNPIPAGKVFAAAAKLADAKNEYNLTFDFATKAIELNDRAGVKKLRDKAIEKLADEQEKSEKK